MNTDKLNEALSTINLPDNGCSSTIVRWLMAICILTLGEPDLLDVAIAWLMP